MRIVVVGAGVVGFATGCCLREKAQHQVLFVDSNQQRVNELQTKNYHASLPCDMDLEGVDAVFVSVPTPSDENGFDTRYLQAAAASIGHALKNATSRVVIVFRSTMAPGTTEELLIPIVEQISHKKAMKDFGVCYNPEYLRALSAYDDFASAEFATVGYNEDDKQTLTVMKNIYKPLNVTVKVCDLRTAEYHKLVHNTFNAVKISFYNEARRLAEACGANADKAFALTTHSAEGMTNPAYGTFDLGPFDGACLPKDSRAYAAVARSHSIATPVTDGAIKLNREIGGE